MAFRRARLVFCRLLLACGVSCLPATDGVAQNHAPGGPAWKPLCADAAFCSRPYDVRLGGGAQGYHPLNRFAAGPLVVPGGLVLQMGDPLLWVIDPVTGEGRFPGLDDPGAPISDVNAVTLPDGFTLSLSLYGRGTPEQPVDSAELRDTRNRRVWSGSWHGQSVLDLNNAAMIAPTILPDGTIYAGIRFGGGTRIYRSTNRGERWSSVFSGLRIGEDRFNLLPSPSGSKLWAINSAFDGSEDSLWVTDNHGADWTRVDDGSLPDDTVRIVHHPGIPDTSYALSARGLYVSRDRGRRWTLTGWAGAVNGLLVLDAIEDAAARPEDEWNLVLGADDGVYFSRDEGQRWRPLARGLPALPSSIAFSQGVLVAVNDAGFFTCAGSACVGDALPAPEPQPGGVVVLRELYSPSLDVYRLEAAAGPGEEPPETSPGDWAATGFGLPVWSLGSSATTTSLCDFERRSPDGRRARFFTVAGSECGFLIDRQADLSEAAVGWRLQPYRYAVVPAEPILPDRPQARDCPKHTQRVMRLYRKNGPVNHRFLLLPDYRSLTPDQLDRWFLEGPAFCVPG